GGERVLEELFRTGARARVAGIGKRKGGGANFKARRDLCGIFRHLSEEQGRERHSAELAALAGLGGGIYRCGAPCPGPQALLEGRGQAVRLPAEFRFEGEEVEIAAI